MELSPLLPVFATGRWRGLGKIQVRRAAYADSPKKLENQSAYSSVMAKEGSFGSINKCGYKA